MAISTQRLDPPPPLKEVLMRQGVFGMPSTQQNIRGAINSTQNTLRYGPQPASVDAFGTPFGSTGGMIPRQQGEIDAAMKAHAASQAQPAAPQAQAPADPFAVPMAPVPRADQFNPLATPGVRTAGALAGLEGMVPALQFNTALRDAGVNLNPVGQAPGDFGRNMQAAINLYNRTATSQSGVTRPQPRLETFAPTDLRQRAIAANGSPVAGSDGVTASATAKPGGGYSFSLVGQRGGVRPETAVQAAQPETTNNQNAGATETPYERDLKAYRRLTNPELNTTVITSPDGSRFQRDANGRLQAMGSDPDITKRVKADEAAAVETAKQETQQVFKLLDKVEEDAVKASKTASTVGRIRQLYDTGLKTGFAQQQLTTAASIIGRITGKEEKLANQQELEARIGEVAVELQREFAKGGGQVSNYERELFAEAGPNKRRTPEANMQILSTLENMAQRDMAVQDERIRLESIGVPPKEIAKELRAYRAELVKKADEEYGANAAGAQPTRSQPAKVGRFTVEVAQ